jgi:hypothetical protein
MWIRVYAGRRGTRERGEIAGTKTDGGDWKGRKP